MNKEKNNISKKIKLSILALFMIGGAFIVHHSSCSAVYAISCPHQEDVVVQIDEKIVNLATGYNEFSPQSLTDALKNGRTVLYFWAPWCSTCTSLDLEIIDSSVKIPEGVTVLRINYDEATTLKKKYNVVTQHTFVQIDKNENAIVTWVGGGIENFAKYLQ